MREGYKNSLIVDEEIHYNKYLFDKSISKIKSKRFKSEFQNKKLKMNDKKIIDIIVEKSTGEIFAGAELEHRGTYSWYFENNYLGKGKLTTNFNSENQIKGNFR